MFILSLLYWTGEALCVCVCVVRMLADMDFVMEVIGPLWWNIDSGCIFPRQNVVFNTVCRI